MNVINLMQQINMLKQQYSNPNDAIQQLLNSGKVSQQQYNNAVRQAQEIQKNLARLNNK